MLTFSKIIKQLDIYQQLLSWSHLHAYICKASKTINPKQDIWHIKCTIHIIYE